MSPSRLRNEIALLTVMVLVAGVFGPAVQAGSAASLSGRVFQEDGRTPRSGVVVSLVDETGRRELRSTPTTGEGAFVIADAAVGEYLLVVETPEGAFVTGNQVRLEPGANRPVALTLTAGQQFALPQNAQSSSSNTGLPTWAKWVIAGGIIVGALLILDEINSDESPASGF